MKHIIETERLILRNFSLDDAQNLYDLNLDPDVLKYTGDRTFDSVNSARTFLKNYIDYKENGYGRWAVIKKDTDRFIGWCGLKFNEENLIDVGFRIFRKEWNKGYATESAKASIQYGFETLQLNEIIARVSAQNKSSLRVIEKLKMVFWKYDYCSGIENAMYFRMNKNNYDPLV